MAGKSKSKRMKAAFTFDGKRYYVYGYSKKELDDKIYEKRKALEEGAENRVNPTLNDYYITFTENRRRSVRESTIRSQGYQFRNCADVGIDSNGKTLGECRLQEIIPDDINVVQRALAESGRTTETVNNSINHLRHVFNQAVKSRYLEYNPCDAVESLRRTEPPARETIHRALSVEETAAFFEEARNSESYYYNHFAMMVKTGVRVGELGALTAFDLNVKDQEILIRKTVARDEIGVYIVSDMPKTDAGNRAIPVDDEIIQIFKQQQRQNKIVTFSDMPQIFRTPEGALLREYQINREIKRICKRAGIEKFTSHAFRATFATRFIEQRPGDYKPLSEILGHANTDITLNLYAHVMKETKVKAMKAVVIAI